MHNNLPAKHQYRDARGTAIIGRSPFTIEKKKYAILIGISEIQAANL